MTLKELLTDYWSQVVLVLGFLGFFVQRIYSLRLKNQETRHSLFQQNKINAIIGFLNCYSKNDHLFNQIQYHKIIKREYTTTEMDGIFWPTLDELKTSIKVLTLYFGEKDIVLFEEILLSYIKLYTLLLEFYFEGDKTKTGEMGDEYFYALHEATKKNREKVFEIGSITRKIFNS